jgi:hypothetical protein
MSKENVTFVQNVYDNFSRGDIQGVFGSLDPEVQFCQSEEVPCKVLPFDAYIDNPKMIAALHP